MNPSSNCHPPNESSSFAKKEERMMMYYGANNKPATLKERIKMRKRISLLAAHEEEVAIDPYYSSSSPSLASFSSSSFSSSESSQSIAPPPMNAIVDASRRSSVLEAASALASLFGGAGDAFSSCPVVPPSDPPSSSPPLAALEGAASEGEEGDSSSATGHALWSRSFALSLGADVPLTFPQKLMMALSDPDSSDILSWLPHGKGFVIRNKRRFANEVMPRHFGGRASGIAKYTSFTRKLNRWGYKRVVSGKEVGAYYHDDFRRGDADACKWMRPLSGGGAMATAYGASEDDDDDDEKKDDAREDEATNTTNKKDVPVVKEALGGGDEMPPPSSRSLNGKPSKSVQPSFGLPREGDLQQNQYPMFRSVQQEDRRQQLQPSTVQGSSVQLSPTQHQLQQLALLQHQQKVLQQQQQLMQQQPLAHVLSMKSTSDQQKLLLLRLQQQQLQLQLHRNARHAETASSLAIQNLLGVDTTSSRNHQQIISNSLSVLKSHIERGLLDITTPATKAAMLSAYASSLPPAAPYDVRGHVHAKMLARPREEVDECDDRGGGKRQRAGTTTSLAASSSSPPAVDNRAVLMSQSKRPKKTNRRLAASRAQNDLARLWNEINSRTQLLASSNVSAPPPLPPRPKRKYSRPVRRASASAA